MNRSLRCLALAVSLLVGSVSALLGQGNDCGVPLGTATTPLPNWAGTLPGGADMTVADGDNYLYVLTQWGFARGPLGTGSNPGPYTQIVMGSEAGSGSPGAIQVKCDCHQGSNTMDVAEAPDGTSRMISDWQPYAQGGPDPGDQHFSGFAAQVAKTIGAGNPTFGQQIELPNAVGASAQIAAIYIESTGKYFGYFPVVNAGVYMADVTNPTGNSSPGSAIQPTPAIGWQSGAISGTGARVHAKHVVIPGYDKYLLVGSTPADDVIHVAEINTSSGMPIEVANRTGSAQGNNLDIGVINNEIYIFAASSSAGLKVYKFTPPSLLTEVAVPAAISGNIRKVDVSGPPPFPALTLYRDAGGSGSFVDIWDTKWLQGSNPIRARSLQHYQAPDASYRGAGFESYVVQSGGTVTSYIYRELNPPPPGLPDVQSPIHTDKIDISCIAADPDAPPIPYANLTNLSAAGRTSPENTKNYFGDKWQITDASVSFLPILKLEWDFHYTSSFVPEATVLGADLRGYTYNPAYWPCDALNGGNIGTGANCYSSLGPIVSSYQLALQAENVNPPDTQTFLSQSYTLLQPQISIIGFDEPTQTLSVLAGNPNNGDASGTQGNIAEATFNWTFTPGGPATGPVVTVPSNATSFSLNVTYKGGYSTSKGGAVQQVDLVPDFSLTPNPVLKSATLTLRNLMQKAAAATLNSVTYTITPSGGSGTLAGSFLPVNGTAPVTAPSTVGNYTMNLVYNYTDHLGQPKTAPVSKPFSVTDFVPIPALGVYKAANHTQPVFPIGNPPSYGLTTGTTYYLFDDETLPGGLLHPGASFYKSSNSNQSIDGADTLIGETPGEGPQTLASVPGCTTSCYIKVDVQGTVRAFKYTATSGIPPPPPPPPPGATLTLTGPPTGVVGTPVSFTATATGFPGAVTYGWDFGDTGGGGGGNPPPPGGCPPIAPNCDDLQGIGVESLTPGPPNNTHTYTAAGTYTVLVQASSGSTVKNASRLINIDVGGPPPPINTFSVAGATFNPFNNTYSVQAGFPVTFTAAETDPTATFGWDFGDGFSLPASTAGKSVTYAFKTAGSPTVSLTVTNANGTSSGSARFDVSPPSFQAIMIPGAGSICEIDEITQRCKADVPTWATDLSITNPGNSATTVTLYFAAFKDTIPSDLSTLPFDSQNSVPLDPGQSWSGVDVISDPDHLNRNGAGKGILLLKFTGTSVPIVTSRVYFTSAGASFGTALPSYLVGPFGQNPAFQQTQATTDQVLVGLRTDSLYRFNVSLFNASSQGGDFRLDAFTEDGEQVVSDRHFAVPAYSQAGFQDTDLLTPDPSKRYVLKVSNSTGSLQAFASVLDRRNNDLVQVADDTPRVAAAPGDTVDYFISGVGRIEDESTNTHWRTDLRFYNSSAQARDLFLEYHYMPAGATAEKVVVSTLHLAPSQGVSIDDFVGSHLNQSSEEDLTVGTVLGVLKVSSIAPLDVATAPLILGGRIYADHTTGTAGMQLSTYSAAETVAAGGRVLVMPGAQTNLRFRTNIGLFATSSEPTTVRITLIRQDGSEASHFDYVLNNPGISGAFAQVPMTTPPFQIPEGDTTFGDPKTVKVQSLSGGSVGAYIVTVDQISADTVFIQGR